MPQRRVLLLREPSLLAEGLERLLRQMEEVELSGPWDLNSQLLTRLPEAVPDILFIAEEDADAADTSFFINRILERHPDLPIVRIGMRQNTIRLYTSRVLPARTAELVDLIRNLPVHQLDDAEQRA